MKIDFEQLFNIIAVEPDNADVWRKGDDFVCTPADSFRASDEWEYVGTVREVRARMRRLREVITMPEKDFERWCQNHLEEA